MSVHTPNKRKRIRVEEVVVAFDRCCKALRNPESWVVEQDASGVEDVWLLLAEGKVLTTSNAKNRSNILRRRQPEKLFCGLRMSSRGSRDADICTFENGRAELGFRDNQRGEVALLHDMLAQVMGDSSTVIMGTTRQGKPLRSPMNKQEKIKIQGDGLQSQIFQRHLGRRASLRRQEEDRMLSAVFHWRCNIAAKAFQTWKFSLERNKLVTDGRKVVQLGLRNLGNTCYLNAVLQALFSVSSFANAFASDCSSSSSTSFSSLNQVEESSVEQSPTTWRSRRQQMLAEMQGDDSIQIDDQSLGTEFRKLCRMISSNKLVRYTPDGILRLVWRLFGDFRGFKQHDAAEIMAHLIERLEVEEKGTVQRLFGGQLCQRIEFDQKATKAKVSKKKKKTVEKGLSNSSTSIPFCGPWALEIPEQYRQVGRQRKITMSCSLHDCIGEATVAVPISEYELDDGTRTEASKQTLFDSFPKILVLHINRTAWGLNDRSLKVHTNVEFPMTLSVGQYRVHGEETQYELCSIVAHHGQQMSSGHFTAYGKRNGQWHHFNDAKVTIEPLEEILAVQPYILIYELVAP